MATSPTTKSNSYVPMERKLPRRAFLAGRIVDYGIVEEQSFIHMLRLERKRTERSGKPFMLMLLDAREILQDTKATNFLAGIVSAISNSTRETDTLGWYERNTTLGVLFTEIGSADSASVNKVVEKVTLAMQAAVSAEEFKRLHIIFRVFPEHSLDNSEQGPDFTLYPDFSERHQPRRAGHLFKRMIDIAGSLFALIVFSPVLALIALLVKLTSEGPILFRQNRVGKYGAPFTFLKFRSMYANNDPRVHQEYVAKLIAGKGDLQQPDGSRNGAYKLTNDPRITPLGRFLRKTSLDELPQFFNVLKGEMSLVGPRPPVPYEFDRYRIWHKRRVLEIRPGITGLWQVNGRSKTTFDDMVRLDLRYARIWSIWLDMKILLQTPIAVLSGDGAH
jgi:exopolysaccharide biosynthesis polyprenyl glycosylphosphotransferase